LAATSSATGKTIDSDINMPSLFVGFTSVPSR
jgi:hypothetical protein